MDDDGGQTGRMIPPSSVEAYRGRRTPPGLSCRHLTASRLVTPIHSSGDDRTDATAE